MNVRLGHVKLAVTDLEASRHFYSAASGSSAGRSSSSGRARSDSASATRSRSPSSGRRPRGPGLHRFDAPDEATVDAFHAAALAAGGRDNGAPGLRPYGDHYYAAFPCSTPIASF